MLIILSNCTEIVSSVGPDIDVTLTAEKQSPPSENESLLFKEKQKRIDQSYLTVSWVNKLTRPAALNLGT